MCAHVNTYCIVAIRLVKYWNSWENMSIRKIFKYSKEGQAKESQPLTWLKDSWKKNVTQFIFHYAQKKIAREDEFELLAWWFRLFKEYQVNSKTGH